MPITLDGSSGITTPGLTNTGTETIVNLTSTGNTTLGDATTDTLTVGVNGIVKDASGNVGIGTASPGARLQVTNTDGEMARFRTSSGSNQPVITISASDSAATVGFATGGNASFPAMTFANGGSERMRIDSSGRLLLATTTTVDANAFMSIRNVNGTTGGIGIGNSVGSSDTNCITFFNSNGQVGRINTNGSATGYVTSSDYRLKEDIAPMTGALNKVVQLKPVTYKWKADGSHSEGFIAHELQTVVPDCVFGEKDAVDADGNPIYQGIDTSFLVATLTAAIQELSAQVKQLTIDVAELKGKK